MYRLSFLFCFLFFAFSVCFANGNGVDSVGDIRSKVIDAIGFREVYASKGVNVTLIKGDKEGVAVDVENGNPDDVVTNFKKNRIYVGFRNKIVRNVSVQVYVTYVNLDKVSAATGASVVCDEPIKGGFLELKVSTGGKINVNVDVDRLKVSSMASRVEARGSASHQDVNLSAGGKYIADGLVSEDAVISVSTGSSATVDVRGSLSAKCSTGSNVFYVDKPRVLNVKDNTGGSVLKVGDSIGDE